MQARTGCLIVVLPFCAVIGCVTEPQPPPPMAQLVKAVPATRCISLGVMYGRGVDIESAIKNLRVNTKQSGGSHVIVNEHRETNKDRFDMDNLTLDFQNNLILGDGYNCDRYR